MPFKNGEIYMPEASIEYKKEAPWKAAETIFDGKAVCDAIVETLNKALVQHGSEGNFSSSRVRCAGHRHMGDGAHNMPDIMVRVDLFTHMGYTTPILNDFAQMLAEQLRTSNQNWLIVKVYAGTCNGFGEVDNPLQGRV